MLIKPVKCLLIVLVSCISFPALAQGDSAISKPKVLVSDSAISYDPTHDRFYKNGHEYVRNEFQYHNKRYMFETHILLEWIKPGITVLNGYKFNQFAALAIGVGIELPVNYNLEARGQAAISLCTCTSQEMF